MCEIGARLSQRLRGTWIIRSLAVALMLHKGAADLDLETEHVTRELSLLLQALIILSVSAEGLWSWMGWRGNRKLTAVLRTAPEESKQGN